MGSKILNVRMSEELHADFKAFCESVHIPASTLMAAFAAQTVRLGRVPFDIQGDESAAGSSSSQSTVRNAGGSGAQAPARSAHVDKRQGEPARPESTQAATAAAIRETAAKIPQIEPDEAPLKRGKHSAG